MTPTEQDKELRPIPIINGIFCPACGHSALMLGDGGYITCCIEDCPNPDYADAIATHDQQLLEAILEGKQTRGRIGINGVRADSSYVPVEHIKSVFKKEGDDG